MSFFTRRIAFFGDVESYLGAGGREMNVYRSNFGR